jgi:hypothetical protein
MRDVKLGSPAMVIDAPFAATPAVRHRGERGIGGLRGRQRHHSFVHRDRHRVRTGVHPPARGDLTHIRAQLDGISAEQLSPAPRSAAYFVQLLVRPGISHVLTLARLGNHHNSPLRLNTWAGLLRLLPASCPLLLDRPNSEVGAPKVTVGLAGGDLRADYGMAAPPKSYPRIAEDSGPQLSGALHPA